MSSPRSSPSSSFSLVARDLARARGSFTVLDAVDVAVGPRTRLGVVGPNGVGKTTLLRLLAGLDRPDRGTVTRTPPSLQVGYLPQEPERGDETLLAFLGRRTGVTAAEAELERAATALGAGAERRDRGRRLQRRARRLPRARRRRSRRPCPRAGGRPRAARAPAATRRPAPSRAGRRPGHRWPPSCSAASTCSCSTSPPTTSTSPGSTGSSASSTTCPAAWSW